MRFTKLFMNVCSFIEVGLLYHATGFWFSLITHSWKDALFGIGNKILRMDSAALRADTFSKINGKTIFYAYVGIDILLPLK